MNTYLILLICTISGFSTMLGNIIIYFPIKKEENILSFGFGLSFIVMFLISITELIPVGISLVKHLFSSGTLLFLYTFFFLGVGAYLIIWLNKKIANESKLLKLGILSMITILIHNIPEGIICAITGLNDINLGLKMIFLILLHNIPEGISVALPIYYATKNKRQAFLYTFISGLGEVLGALITILFLRSLITNTLLSIIYISTAGIMIYLSTNKILMTSLKYRKFLSLLIGILTGMIILLITM